MLPYDKSPVGMGMSWHGWLVTKWQALERNCVEAIITALGIYLWCSAVGSGEASKAPAVAVVDSCSKSVIDRYGFFSKYRTPEIIQCQAFIAINHPILRIPGSPILRNPLTIAGGIVGCAAGHTSLACCRSDLWIQQQSLRCAFEQIRCLALLQLLDEDYHSLVIVKECYGSWWLLMMFGSFHGG